MNRVNRQRLIYGLTDFITANIGFCLFDIGRFYLVPPRIRPDSLIVFLCDRALLLEQIFVPVFVVALYALAGSYNRSNTLYKSRLDETVTSAAVSATAMFAVFFAALINDGIAERITNYELMGLLWACLFIPACITRLFIVSHNAARIRKGEFVIDTYLVGARHDNIGKIEKIKRSSMRSGLRIVGCIDEDNIIEGDTFAGLPVYRGDDIQSLSRNLGAEALIVLPSYRGVNHTADVLNALYPLDKPLFVTPDLQGMMGMRPKVSSVVNEPVVDITNARIQPFSVNCKRLGDIVVSSVALIVLSPLLAAIALAVRLDSQGPVFYSQKRIGYHKKPFNIHKFRTMRADAESNGPALASENDPRVTRIGRFLRKYRLDELPQFWNVLCGEMSLVGPRPEREYYIKRILERHPAYSLIHQVRPGITSWGMVKYGYASNVDEMLERLQYDLLYIENVSLGVDLKILFYTVSTVLTGKGL